MTLPSPRVALDTFGRDAAPRTEAQDIEAAASRRLRAARRRLRSVSEDNDADPSELRAAAAECEAALIQWQDAYARLESSADAAQFGDGTLHAAEGSATPNPVAPANGAWDKGSTADSGVSGPFNGDAPFDAYDHRPAIGWKP